ncbi:hypothetical protein [Pseudoxanthomonas winnipegensis]|uniref:Uncharacterized protein n=1 Tax=Pseudoxanthomonas winnipegensis TaxID=2480810 RepID=A0A4Q8M4J4_9GAMM|nr:hypothetical protein [Pseudoxanthomonas winnipegensis]TAA41575.1 hypothetical protein EA655_11585 [Pseudoxanthomonas winnipegensis]
MDYQIVSEEEFMDALSSSERFIMFHNQQGMRIQLHTDFNDGGASLHTIHDVLHFLNQALEAGKAVKIEVSDE